MVVMAFKAWPYQARVPLLGIAVRLRMTRPGGGTSSGIRDAEAEKMAVVVTRKLIIADNFW